MKWISKHAPIYVWEKDTWFKEDENKTFIANLERKSWDELDSNFFIPFTMKTVICKDKNHKFR